jgi:hypothetical protein
MDTSSETSSVHPTPDPWASAIVNLGGTLTDSEWNALLARFPEGSAERAEAVRLLFDVITPQMLVGLSLVDLVHVLWMFDDGDLMQFDIAERIKLRRPDFAAWTDVVTRLPQYWSTHEDCVFALQSTLSRMRDVLTSAEWIRLAEVLTVSWHSHDTHRSAFYRAVIRACGQSATAMADLQVAYKRSVWDASERIAIFERLLALSPDFDTTHCVLEPLTLRSYPDFAPGEYQELRARFLTRLLAQTETYEQFRILENLTHHDRSFPWRAEALEVLAFKATTFEELIDTLDAIGNDPQAAQAGRVAERKLRSVVRAAARSYAEWMEIARYRARDSRVLQGFALREALATASTLEERLELLSWAVAPTSTIHRAHRRILVRILGAPLTTAQFRQLLLLERDRPRLRRKVLQVMAAQPLDLERAYLLTVLAPPASPSSFEGGHYLAEAHASFAEWDALLTIEIHDNLRLKTQQRLPLNVIYMEDADYPLRCRFVLGKLTALAQSEQEWRRVLEIATKAGVTNAQVAAWQALARLLRQTLTAAPASV